jgi:hypothetical protein
MRWLSWMTCAPASGTTVRARKQRISRLQVPRVVPLAL